MSKLVILLSGVHLSGKSVTWRELFRPTEDPSSETDTAYRFVKRLRYLLVKGKIVEGKVEGKGKMDISEPHICTEAFLIDKSPEENGVNGIKIKEYFEKEGEGGFEEQYFKEYLERFGGQWPAIVLCSTWPDSPPDYLPDYLPLQYKKDFFKKKGYKIVVKSLEKHEEGKEKESEEQAKEVAEDVRQEVFCWLITNA